MPGEIKHTWVGTTLIVESDSGTSGANLKGEKGDIGPRGPQGPAGVVYNQDGEIVMEGYATEQYVQDLISGSLDVDLTGYATEDYVNQQIAAIPQPDLTGYATKEEVTEAIAAIPEVDLTGYATETYVDEKIAAIPQTDLTGYATETYVDEKFAEMPEIDLTGYATETYVDLAIEAIPIPDLEDYATKDYVDITTNVALSNHYTKDEIDEALANLEPGGGGGGSSDNNAVLTLQNKSGWLYKILANGAECLIKGTWSSLEDGLETGNGVVTVAVNSITKHAVDVPQGEFSINIAPYLSQGTNSVQVTVTDVYANTRSIIYSVEVVTASISSTFNGTTAYEGAITYTYVPLGNVDKTVSFFLDGSKIGVQQVTTSGRQQTFTIPAQSHGAHRFEVYFTANISGTTVESNHLSYDLICIESGMNVPIVACATSTIAMTQFETVSIYYSVYTPNTLTSEIELFVDNVSVKELTVDRTQQLWSFRADEPGTHYLKIKSGTAYRTITIGVTAAEMDVEATTTNLELYLTSYGRSNSEKDPASWIYNDIECSFENYNWKSDGWVADENGLIVHRLSGDARLYVPFNMFETDARDTGKTIEIEFATRDTLDYDAVIATCMADGVGFEMTAQKAVIKSEQASATTQYKENEHIRLSFVIEKRAENRLIYTYLNGIMCGAVQYADNDNFAQANPVGITFGSNFATMDIYTIRVYDNSLTRHQMLDNWIADTQDINEKYARYTRNNVYDAYGNIIIANLPNNLPYLILSAPALPESKGNEVIVGAQYIDPLNEDKSFSYAQATADVQGTSSAGYVRKNYIIEYPDTYQLREDSIPTNVFTYKADVASSEGANNVELVRLYDAISPYRTPPQVDNPSVRQGIDGFPIVIFHDNGTETKFIGKYNFNNDKKTPEVFGFTTGDESWEIRNNTSNRVLFKSADFEGTDWLNDFEARYPKGNENAEKLAAFAEWVVSTDTTAATNVDGDTAEARLAKFKTELEDHAELQSALFYYLFTELFLMVDSRAKNAFPTFFNGNKVCWLPYDMDTAMGINNEGSLVFGYELEDIDHTASGADVYNGQKSVFWNNLRDCYGDEIKAMYQKLRSDKVLTYDIVEQMFEDHQTVWPEAIWNEDAWYKYLQPLVEDNNGSYLGMLQGNKEEQRKWWLYNRFRYMDSKYNAGDAETDFITLRGYEKDNITIEPYADIYATIKYGSYLVQERALRGNEYTLECPMDTLNDTEIYIYSSSQLRGIGDLSGLKVGYADFASATKLQSLKLGDAASTYTNSNLTELYLGNNTLLQTLDVRNCPMLGSGEKQQSIDLSGCTNIENVYFDGTTIKGCSLPNGGILKVLHLPETITNLTIRNQKALTDLSIPNYSNISTLRLENVNETVDMEAILRGIKSGSRVRLIGINWSFETASEVEELFDILDTMTGLDENDKNMDKAQISGTIHVPAITSEELETLKSRYSTVTYTYDSLAYNVHYVNYDGTELYTYAAAAGSKAIDPVSSGLIDTPTKPASTGYTTTFKGWDSLPVITGTTTITAQYRTVAATYTVTFKNGSQTLQTSTVSHGQSVSYTGTTPVAADGAVNTLFAGWYPLPKNVTSNMTCSALFASERIEVKKITDSWDTILANIDNGTYATKYKRGNYVTMNLGGTNGKYDMQIIGFNCDELSGGGYAPITWLSRHIMPSNMSFNSTSDKALWVDSTLREYLNSTVYGFLPENIRTRVASVKKFTSNGALEDSTSVDKLWIPDYYYEMTVYGGGKDGIYYDMWNDGDLDIAYNNGLSNRCDNYWTRSNVSTSANGVVTYKYRYMKLNTYTNTFVWEDSIKSARPYGGYGVRFGFCT